VPHRYNEFKRWNCQRDAQHLIGVSRATACEVEQWAGRPCTVIGHGVDALRFHPDSALRAQVRQELGFGLDTKVLITVAALEERKGVQFVIQAMPRVLEEMPDTRYLIIGDGPHREKLMDQANRLDVQNNVLFLGFQAKVERFLATGDVALLLSCGEASPISILECCAAGLPVITSPHPPFPELVQPAWGQMVLEQDGRKVSQAIINLLSDVGSRSRKGAHGRAWVIENNNWHQVARQYQELVGSNQ
jgi:glycosyltransferase involved in cell wall biosynthesis